MRIWKELGLGLLSMTMAASCSKAKEEGTKSSTADERGRSGDTEEGKSDGPRAGTEKGQGTAAAEKVGTSGRVGQGQRLLGEKVEAELLETPVERRLYSDRIEASSFLWVNYNRFQENYHPNYILDGDPRTAWIEGAEGNGIGEWVRINLSPLSKVSALRLKIQNGYHKSEKLFKQNARVTELEIKALPGGDTKTVELADDMSWQELNWDLETEKLEGIELKVLGAAKGSKYKDLAISDVEIYVTARTKENPAFEKKQLAKLLEWKKSRLEAAELFSSMAAKELPIKPGYRVRDAGPLPKDEDRSGTYPRAEKSLRALDAKVEGHEELFARAMTALEEDFKGWKVFELTVRKAPKIPAVDGLRRQDQESLIYHWPSDAFVLPEAKRKTLINNQRISLFESKLRKNQVAEMSDCEPDEVYGMRKVVEGEGPSPRELVVWHCVEEEEREGTYTYLAWELYEYDDAGNLVLSVSPSRAQYLDWRLEGGRQLLVGGMRVDGWGKKYRELVSDEAVAMAPKSPQTQGQKTLD